MSYFDQISKRATNLLSLFCRLLAPGTGVRSVIIGAVVVQIQALKTTAPLVV
jgi:hypothetical protein